MTTLTQEAREELREWLANESVHPWAAESPEWANGWHVVAIGDIDDRRTIDNSGDGGFDAARAYGISAMRNALPALLDAADERDRLADELEEARAAIRFLWFRVGLYEKYGFDGGYPAEHAAAITQAQEAHG